MVARTSSAVVLILIALTLLGHACELPLEAVVPAHSHAEAHDSSDHHDGDEAQVTCEAVLGLQSGAHPSHSGVLHVSAHPHPVVSTVAFRVAAVLPESHTGQFRPPLFLLHAALLI